MISVFERLSACGIVPVIEIADARRSALLGRALLAGGIGCAEITFRTDAAADAIRAMRAECAELIVGAGTILSQAQADVAIRAGAAFLVAPGFNPDVVDHARRLRVPMLPGVCTPSEIERAMARGLTVLKFFPAEVAGGVAFLKAVAPVYPSVRFVPTGGIGPGNLAGYAALANVLACGGSWMAKRELVASGDFVAVERLAAEAIALVKQTREQVQRA